MTYDIAIVGGGVAGLTLACALAQKTALSIAVLESQPAQQTWQTQQYSHRVSAITLASARIFASLNIWQAIKARRVSPFKTIQVWDEANHGEIGFSGADVSETYLGYIVENNAIQDALLDKVQQYANVKLISPIVLQEYSEIDNGVRLVADNGSEIMSRCVIAADGANSWLRNKADIAIDVHDYEQDAIVAEVATELPHACIARQVFQRSGILAFLPLLDANRCSIVWSLPRAQAAQLCMLDERTFCSELTEAFSKRLGNVVTVGKRYTFPLRMQTAQQYIKPRLALIGDAAHTVHPLAGQGLNMGLLDVACLAEVMIDAYQSQRDYFSLATLRRYERWRKADNKLLQFGVDNIKALFANDDAVIRKLRFLGLSATNHTNWIKNLLMRYAIGNRRHLPKLAQNC